VVSGTDINGIKERTPGENAASAMRPLPVFLYPAKMGLRRVQHEGCDILVRRQDYNHKLTKQRRKEKEA
jgi:hypothetical protein